MTLSRKIDSAISINILQYTVESYMIGALITRVIHMTPRPILLLVLDGWGCRATAQHNAIAAAQTPTWNKLLAECPQTTLSASGLDVGLPENQMGNSEVGHLTLGAGRVVFQDLTRISETIDDGTFNQNPVLKAACETAAKTQRTLHVLGLLSPGGVHSHEDHLRALVWLAARKGVPNVLIHAFLDGRDTPPQSAKTSLLALQKVCQSMPNTTHARIASISGRYYAMDRDKRWERTQAVYELLTEGEAKWFSSSATEALIAAYNRGETDEFVNPTLITPVTPIVDGEVVVFMNFRSDRARQLSAAFCDTDFSGFTRTRHPQLADFVTLTEYDKNLKATVAFPPISLKNMLGEYLQDQHLRQLRIAETEKYAHVTFFLNGGRETPFEGEDRILVPSPKVATYDLCPEMSAVELTEKLVTAIRAQRYDVIIGNYANADMVGHTGNFSATVQAIETLDICLGKVLAALKEVGGEALITADHGNAELMFDQSSEQPHTAHTLERVPLIYVGRPAQITQEQGTLSDVAPTVLALMNLPKPAEMTGTSLISLK